jgi:hypothetical protein
MAAGILASKPQAKGEIQANSGKMLQEIKLC